MDESKKGTGEMGELGEHKAESKSEETQYPVTHDHR